MIISLGTQSALSNKNKWDGSKEFKLQEIKLLGFKFLPRLCPYFHLSSNTCGLCQVVTATHVGRISTESVPVSYIAGEYKGKNWIAGVFQILHYRKAALLPLHPAIERLTISLLPFISEIGEHFGKVETNCTERRGGEDERKKGGM